MTIQQQIGALQRISRMIGLELVEFNISGTECFAFTALRDPDCIVFGPIVDREPLALEAAADHLACIIEDMEPGEIDTNLIGREVDEQDTGEFFTVMQLAVILDTAEALDNSDFRDELIESVQQQILDVFVGIVEEVKRDE